MAITTHTKMANRFGLKTYIYAATDTALETLLATLDFVNVSDIDINSDRVFWYAGQAHAKQGAFDNPMEGTFKLSTQETTAELLALIAGEDLSTFDGTSIDFKTSVNTVPKYYIIKSDTVWVDESGTTYAETMTFHKVCPQKAYNISYNGDGDPVSVDVTFDVMQDDNGKVLTIRRVSEELATADLDIIAAGSEVTLITYASATTFNINMETDPYIMLDPAGFNVSLKTSTYAPNVNFIGNATSGNEVYEILSPGTFTIPLKANPSNLATLVVS